MKEDCILTASRTPNQIRSIPINSATGPSNGTIIKANSKESRKNAKKKDSTLTTTKKPSSPPGMSINRLSTHKSPLIPLKLRLKIVEPTKMKMTKHDKRVVLAMAWLSNLKFRRRRDTAITMAPTAPMAPPSVGVATPMKIVPKTRKIKNNGGIMTKVTRSAIWESKPSLKTLFTDAMIKAATPHRSSTITMLSSRGTDSWVEK